MSIETPMNAALDAATLDQLFRTARSHNGWLPRDVSEEQLHELYELMKFGPTQANCTPARIVFVKSAEAKERLRPTLDQGNVAKSMSAPVVAIIGSDMAFYDQLPKLFPHADARSWFVGNDEAIRVAAFRNSSLQGAYLILAARALGLDAGPMSGFDSAKVDAEFFAGTQVRSNFMVALGHGDAAALFPRLPRLGFDEASRIL